MKIIVCPDSFKGSISAWQAVDCIKDRLQAIYPDAEICAIPLADGGEGTAEILGKNFPLFHSVKVHDPLGRIITARFLTDSKGRKAFIESAEIIGLPLLTPQEHNPLKASTFGLGEAIMAAIESGAKEIFISLGGSATCDAGVGLLEALGYTFTDNNNHPIKATASNLSDIQGIILPASASKLQEIKFYAVCDVESPLYGSNGAAHVFAPQKGAGESEVKILEQGIRHFADTASKELKVSKEAPMEVGAGAAGGLGFTLKEFLGAQLIKGVDFVMETLEFDSQINGADLIVTGEGKADRQSLMGKVVGGVLNKARTHKIPVIVIAGKVEDKQILLDSGISRLIEISDPNLSESKNMHPSQTLKNLTSSLLKTPYLNLILYTTVRHLIL